jgi:Protein of unknown function (DUF3568)
MSHAKIVSLKRSVLVAAFVGLPFALLGCTPSLVGPDTAAYSMGNLHARVNRGVAPVYEACVSALEKLEIKVIDKKKDVFGAKVVGRTSDEQTVVIRIKPEGQGRTHFSIHVGSFGSETRSRTIYDQIRKELGLGAEK